MSHAHSHAHDAHAHDHGDHGHGGGAHHVHPPSHYVKIWAILVVLLVLSVLGPMAEIQWLTLVTAFGIALVKAYLVCAYFMHLNIEKPIATFLLTTALVFMFLFWAAVSPDVLKHDGRNWENVDAKAETARALKAQGAAGAHH
jgi:caa(3)-type oxidase subunit IV